MSLTIVLSVCTFGVGLCIGWLVHCFTSTIAIEDAAIEQFYREHQPREEPKP